jgi:tryptophan synthase beta chain
MSMLIDKGYMRSVACTQTEAMGAALTFARTEGVVVAPETSHAVKAAIDIALQCRQKNEAKTILFNLSGHGLLDLKAYEDMMGGRLADYVPDDAKIREALASLPVVS